MTEKQQITIALLKRGWTTALESAQRGGYLSLSQRCGNWRRQGMNIISKWVATSGGSRVMAYRITKAKG